MSSNFFGGLQSGIRFPSAQINQGGPLPGAPYAGLDGQINASDSLLGNVAPYAQPKAGAMGSDRNYQQIPHRMQQVVPMLFLPSADPAIAEPCRVSHPVDFGDIAFSLCSNNVVALMSQNKQAVNMVRAPARNVFCNLVTVNYMLAGLQRLQRSDRNNWSELAENMCYDYGSACDDEAVQMHELLKMLSTRILPYGIVQGSEKQGGQHEMTLAPVQAAANFVVTMTVDGQNRDLVHFWRDSQISAGSQLVYVLEKRRTRKFVLNHYYKQMSQQIFPTEETCWQLIPRVYCAAEETRYKQEVDFHDLSLYDYRVDGYWRVAQSFQHRAPIFDSCNYADDKVFMRGQLLQVTFAPTWVQMDPYTVRKKRRAIGISGDRNSGVALNMRDLILSQSRTNVKLPKKSLESHIAAAAEQSAPANSGSKLLQLLQSAAVSSSVPMTVSMKLANPVATSAASKQLPAAEAKILQSTPVNVVAASNRSTQSTLLPQVASVQASASVASKTPATAVAMNTKAGQNKAPEAAADETASTKKVKVVRR